MIHTFHRAFRGDQLTLCVDLSQTPASFSASPEAVMARNKAEYVHWVNSIVIPNLVTGLARQRLAVSASIHS